MDQIPLDFIIQMYRTTWEDIRHSRTQEWKALEIIVISIIGFGLFTLQTELEGSSMIFGILSITLIIVGTLLTLRHRTLFTEKMELIKNIEIKMEIEKMDILPGAWKKRKKVKILRIGSTTSFILSIYIVLFVSVLFFYLKMV